MLDGVRIVLVEPAGPLNVGSVARVMKNMGLHRLVLVNPQCDPLGEEARLMAVRAADILMGAQRVTTLAEALQGCQRAIATSGRDRTPLDTPLEHPRTALPWLLDRSTQAQAIPLESALVFGREDRGLTNAELNLAQRIIRIPSTDAYPSLNLAQAAAICCYELYVEAMGYEQQERVLTEGFKEDNAAASHWPKSAADPFAPPGAASLDQLHGYYQQLEALLLKIGYLHPQTAASRMEKFRRLFNRAYPSEAEIAMLRGILSQVEWALGKVD